MMVCSGSERIGLRHHRGTAMEYYAGRSVSLEQSSLCVADATGRIVRGWWRVTYTPRTGYTGSDSLPEGYATLALAYAAAQAGDHISLATGTYAGNLTFNRSFATDRP